jgi:hypothetical protein
MAGGSDHGGGGRGAGPGTWTDHSPGNVTAEAKRRILSNESSNQ